MTIELSKSLNDYLSEIGNHTVFKSSISDEDNFKGDFDKNKYLLKLQRRLKSINPLTLNEILCIGAYQVCEALINICDHGKKGYTIINTFLGEKGIAYEVNSLGNGFDFKKIYDKYINSKKYYKKHGFGFKSYSKSHVSVSFCNNGCTTIIKSNYKNRLTGRSRLTRPRRVRSRFK